MNKRTYAVVLNDGGDEDLLLDGISARNETDALRAATEYARAHADELGAELGRPLNTKVLRARISVPQAE